jgi:pantoate--beta-alanine ligase
MRTLRTVAELRSALAPVRREGLTIGLVPTMGALHEGHLSLIERAREQCGRVVVSLFVNPAQFNERSDLDRYPRRLEHDANLAAEAGADLLFAPTIEEVYPAGFATAVEVLGITDRLEGAVRGAAHFRGVTTVVTKLLSMTQPDIAYFGQKDAQQVVVIRHLVRDLNLPVQIEVCPTVREPDGLAMSSRNARLDADERTRALSLYGALSAAAALTAAGERSPAALVNRAREAMAPFAVEPEYLALVDPDTLEPVTRFDAPALLVVAAQVGATRLIDNLILQPAPSDAATAPASTPSDSTAEPTAEPASDAATSNPPTDPHATATPREATATCSA